MFRRFLGPRFLFDEAGDKGGGGGGGGDKGDKGGGPDAAALAKENADLKARLQALEAKNKPPADEEDDEDDDDQDLSDKARKNREREDRSAGDQKALEAALKFTMSADTFLKDNASLLPKNITDIFKAADAEKFDSAKDKANAIKAGVIKSFFEVQSNLDLLTPGLKSQLEDYLKLTNTGRQEKASQIFDTIFEPSFEMLKRVKKAEALGKGYTAGAGDDAYKEKLMRGSRKHHLGVKE